MEWGLKETTNVPQAYTQKCQSNRSEPHFLIGVEAVTALLPLLLRDAVFSALPQDYTSPLMNSNLIVVVDVSLFSKKHTVVVLIAQPQDLLSIMTSSFDGMRPAILTYHSFSFDISISQTFGFQSNLRFIEFMWLFLTELLYGSWFEHTRAWMSMRECDNFLVLSYEDMKKDTRGTTIKICDFLGKKLEPDELDKVLKYSSFQVMKENNMSNFSLIPKDIITNGLDLMRKGTSGDWKNHFTVAEAEAFDKVFQEKMAGFPPELFPWE
ncbi:sulfotransferase family 2A member 1 family member [Sigmodon hispidus]